MTIEKFLSLLSEVSDDATLLSDSRWECGPTDMDGVFYNEKTNEITFTQGCWASEFKHHVGEKCLYFAGWDKANENKKREFEQDLKKSYKCYLDKSRIVKSYLEDF